MRGYNKKYLTDDEKKSSKELVAESEGDTQTVVVEKTKAEEAMAIKTTISNTALLKVDVPKPPISAEEKKTEEKAPKEKPKRFSELKKGKKVIIHLYGKRNSIDYIGTLEQDIKYDKSDLPKTALVKITHAKNRKIIGKILSFTYGQAGKKSRMAWILTRVVTDNKGKEKIKKDYFFPFEFEFKKAA